MRKTPTGTWAADMIGWSSSKFIGALRGNKPKNKQNDEDNDKNVKQDAGDIGTRSRNASKAKNGRNY